MIAIIWHYEVNPAHAEAFEAAYGPEGDWARLFARGDGFLGVELLRGEGDSWLTIDRWRSEADFEAFQAAYRSDYEALDRRTQPWTRDERRIGRFTTDARRLSRTPEPKIPAT